MLCYAAVRPRLTLSTPFRIISQALWIIQLTRCRMNTREEYVSYLISQLRTVITATNENTVNQFAYLLRHMAELFLLTFSKHLHLAHPEHIFSRKIHIHVSSHYLGCAYDLCRTRSRGDALILSTESKPRVVQVVTRGDGWLDVGYRHQEACQVVCCAKSHIDRVGQIDLIMDLCLLYPNSSLCILIIVSSFVVVTTVQNHLSKVFIC